MYLPDFNHPQFGWILILITIAIVVVLILWGSRRPIRAYHGSVIDARSQTVLVLQFRA